MKLFHRKPAWKRAADHLPGGRILRRGALAVAGVIGASAASAAVTAARERSER